jgi:hypothetical protein
MSDFVSFNEFIDRTGDAKVEHNRETIARGLRRQPSPRAARVFGVQPIEPTDDVIEAEFAKMKAFVLARYKPVTNVTMDHTFLGPGGNFHDCVLFEEQPAYQAAKAKGLNPSTKLPTQLAPTTDKAVRPIAQPMLPPLHRSLVDPFGNELACSDDRVPLARVTIAQMARLGKFENFFQKYSSAPLAFSNAAAPDSAIHYHAVCETNPGTYYGCSTFLNVWQVDPSPGVFSLSQLWMLGDVMNTGFNQTIESGWQTWSARANNRSGTDVPLLFVFYNPDGYGDNAGYGTNQYGVGFIVTPGSGWAIDMPMPQPYSSKGGDQYGYQMQWLIDAQGNWVLYLGPGGGQQPTQIGFFPAGLYQGALSQSATVVQFGGEVCSAAQGYDGYPNTGPMGNGVGPYTTPDGTLNKTDSFSEVAFQAQIQVCSTLGGSLAPAQLPLGAADPGYSAILGNDASSPDWGTYMFFGGNQQ